MLTGRSFKTLCMVGAVLFAAKTVAETECTLTSSNRSHSKEIVCATPKVLTFTWQANAKGLNSGWSSWWDVGCEVYVDGCCVENEFLAHGAYGYHSDPNWTEQVAGEQKIYLSPGIHEIRWSLFQCNNWWSDVQLSVDVTDLQLSDLPYCATFYDWAKTVYDDKAFLAGKLDGVIANYDEIIASQPLDYESLICRALAKIAKLGENQTIKDLIGEFGFVPDEFMQYISGEFAGLDNIPQPNTVVDTVGHEVIMAIESAISDLKAIPEDWSGNITLEPEKYPELLNEPIHLDPADIMILRAFLNFARGMVQLAEGYDFSADYLTVSNVYMTASYSSVGAKSFAMLDASPDVGKVRDLQKVKGSKQYFHSALKCLQVADDKMRTRSDSLTYFFEYDKADESDIVNARSLLDGAIKSLDNVETIDGTYFMGKYYPQGELPNGFVRQVYLGALFAGQVTRDCIGRVIDESEFEDYEYLVEPTDVLRLIPDPTFGGVAPDVTISEVVSVCADSQYFNISDYIALSPELQLTLGNSLVVEGVAVKNGKVEFNTATTGFVNCYVNGNQVLEFNPWMEEATSEFSFSVKSGDRYAVEFRPSDEITEPTKLLDFTAVPTPLPDGGSYFETANGVEWAFEVKDGKAIVGTDEYTAIDSTTSRAVAIPATLGCRPVAEIADGAFAWCKNITSLILPATIEKIGDDPFYKCNSLAAITFYGNKPEYVHEDAFSHLASGCVFHATRAANWDGVTIPGTWNGHDISYAAGYNPAVTVASSVTDGTRFEESQSIELSAGDNQTIYYTTDGSDPLTSDTRAVYASPLSITETTTLNYCSVDNATGDWSEIKTANYELIVRMPVGGPYTEVVDGVPWLYYVMEAAENGMAPYYSGAFLHGIDTANYPDFVPKGKINIPSRLGEHPVVEISMFNIPASGFSAVKKITIPDSVKCVWLSAMSSLIMPDPMTYKYPPYCDTTTYPGFVSIDGWIVGDDVNVNEAPKTVDLRTARGIVEGGVVAGEGTEVVMLPESLTRITSSLGLGNNAALLSSLRKIVIPDSVTGVEYNALPLPQYTSVYGQYVLPALFDAETFPGFVAIDGWIVGRSSSAYPIVSDLPEYCDLSNARGFVDACLSGSHNDYTCKTLILPKGVKILGLVQYAGLSVCNLYSLKELFIPDGVTYFGADAIAPCPELKEIYLPRSVTGLGNYSLFVDCKKLYLPDSLRPIMEAYDDTLSMRPIDFMAGQSTEVIYYTTDRYQHALRFDANGGIVGETMRKINRGDLPGLLPTPLRTGYSFAGWTLDEAGKKPFDNSRIVLSDMKLYAQWRSAYEVEIADNGGVSLSKVSPRPIGAVDVPRSIDGYVVRSIGAAAFQGASRMTSVSVPNTVESIEENAFRECTRLESIELPEGITEIGDSAFRECVSLRTITIPSTVTNIGYFAFRDCLRLETVTLLGDPQPHHDLGAFMGVPSFTVISGHTGYVTAIIYATVTNATEEITVPEDWLAEIALMHTKTQSGAESYQAAFEERFGSDLSEALKAPTGKKDLHGNALYVWQDYVAGTDPLDEEDKFTAIIKMVDGVPVVEYSPKLSDGKAELRKYTTYGAKAIGEGWDDVSNLSDEARRDAGYQFFQVTVEMK